MGAGKPADSTPGLRHQRPVLDHENQRDALAKDHANPAARGIKPRPWLLLPGQVRR
jgi:hypothetical protein